MAVVRKKITVPYTPLQMQTLVADVKAYPSFIRWIRRLEVENETKTDAGWAGRATAAVGFKGFSESFCTDVVSDRLNGLVEVALVSGPFKRLQNKWNFKSVDDGCEVSFFIDFEFSSFLLQALLKANFNRAISVLMRTFLDEAERRYGAA